MEKKLPEDNLERFLRASFEDYKQEPSSKVWDQIETGLHAKTIVYKKIKPWMYWGAAASVLAIIIILQFKYNESLNQQLQDVLKHNQFLAEQTGKNIQDSNEVAQLAPVPDRSTDSFNDLNDDEKNTNAVVPSSINDQNRAAIVLNQNEKILNEKPVETRGHSSSLENSTTPSEIAANKEKNSSKQNDIASKEKPTTSKRDTRSTQVVDNNIVQNNRKVNNQSSLAVPVDKTKSDSKQNVKLNEITSSNDQKSSKTGQSLTTAEQTKKESPIDEAIHRSAFTQAKYFITSLDPTTIMPLYVEEQTNLLNTYSAYTPILVNHKLNPSKLELGIVGGVLTEKGEISPKRFFDPRIIDFPKNEYTSSKSWQAGLELTKSFNSHWSVAGGVSIKHFEFVNEITQALAFKNREQPSPGNLPFQHDFKCRIPGPSGSSDIVINSEQLDSRASISDAEEIKITIKNKSQLNYFSIPLSLAYQVNKGKWSVFAKTGIQADLFLSRTVDEPQITLSHPQLQLRKDRPSKPNMDFHHANSVVLNGIISAGLKYQLAPQWSVSLSPGIILPFTQREYNRDIQVDSKIYNFQFGINYTLSTL